MATGRIPLHFPIQSRTASPLKDSRLVNAMIESGQVVKRPGSFLTTPQPPITPGVGHGIYSWNKFLVTLVNNQVLLCTESTTQSIGNLTGAITPISFSQTANDTYLVAHNQANLYTVDKLTNTLSSVLSGTGVISTSVITSGSYYGATRSTTISVNISNQFVCTQTSPGYAAGQAVFFSNLNALPTPLIPGTSSVIGSWYYVVNPTYTIDTLTGIPTSTFQLALTVGGTPITVVSPTRLINPYFVTDQPTVTYSGGGVGATQATGIASCFKGSISSIQVTSPGVYSSIPVVTISQPPPGGTATITYTSPGNTVSLSYGGCSYSSPPIISFPGFVVGTTILTDGVVTGIVISYLAPGISTRATALIDPLLIPATGSANMSDTIKGPFATGICYLNGTFYVLQLGSIPLTSSSPVTISIANPGVVTQVDHSLVAGTSITLATTGALPTGLLTTQSYYIVAPVTKDTYTLSLYKTGAPIQTTGTQSGVHTVSATYITNSRIYGSAPENPNSWPALNFVTAGSDPDSGIGIVRHLNYLVCFGQWSTEFFYDAGLPGPGSSLANMQSSKLEIGCASGNTIASSEQTVLWVGATVSGGRSVYLLDGTSPQKVSTLHIDKYLNKDSMLYVTSFCMKLSGHSLYLLTLREQNITLVYDLDEKSWYFWSSTNGTVESYFKNTFFTSNVEYRPSLYLQDDLTGQISVMSPDVYTDSTNPISFRVVTPNLDNGSVKRKFYRRVEVVGDKSIGTLSIRHSDDDYQSWSNYRTVNLQDSRPILYQNGSARRRAWEVFSLDNAAIRLEALEVDFDTGEQGGGME